jgi:hypothetical protein
MKFLAILSLVWLVLTVVVIAVIEYCTHIKRVEEWSEVYDNDN